MVDKNHCMNNPTMEQRLEVIASMRAQETGVYARCDWLALENSESPQLPHTPQHATAPCDVNSDCREKMVVWCNNVVDFCGYSRETVEIAASYVDRYLATPSGTRFRRNRMYFQLLFMTSLYTAIKIHEETALDTSVFAGFGPEMMKPEDIEGMELKLLHALRWHVNPPTTMGFVRLLLEAVPEDVIDAETLHDVHELSRVQTEFVCSNYHFVTVPPSIVAYCAIMNSLDNLRLSAKKLGYVGYFLSLVLKIDCNSDHVIDVQSFLYPFVTLQMIDRHAPCDRKESRSIRKRRRRRRKSPQDSPKSILYSSFL
ncbi:hypothetical protein FisN_14Lh291 [Fistulifera solaris]|uniref:Cyclin N-terminal domain-containing protein n=1 Tax=Fistulifera solaris TaxID=1519565 RepID=A0A1Z5J9X9_FISSO|nr:hypothetical protein FisN_14Lh291 [Fistulifera solaris]|eukprot:GAX10769.1 hypothetical protein FisN_14Lh291 [Fistulifera solaris]